jgi:mono/diheme cytochrome c family protein
MKKFFSPPAALTLLLPILLAAVSAHALSKKESEQAGAVLFRDKGCAYCHGANSQGTSRGPSLINVRKSWKASLIAEQIKNGGQKMPPFGESLAQDQIDELVSFLRAKHRPVLPPPPVSPPLSNPEQ